MGFSLNCPFFTFPFSAIIFLQKPFRSLIPCKYGNRRDYQIQNGQNHKKTYRIITALLLILWVAFIFSNSMDNADASTLKSGAVLALLRRILGSEGAALTEFIVRKTAHFTEFAIEGVLLFLVVKGYTTRPLRFLGWPLLAGLMTALTDETIQLFSLGRSSQVTDVWIDFAGVVTGTLLVFLVQAIVRRCKKS